MFQALAFLANPAFWSGAANVASTGASIYGASKGAAVAPSVGPLSIPNIGGVQGLVGKIFGNSASKKAKSIAGMASNNQQHAVNYYNQSLTNPGSEYGKFITTQEDYDAMYNITQKAVESIGADPYFGIDKSYTSRYTGKTYATAPSASIAPWVDDYIDKKMAAQKEQEATEKAKAENERLMQYSIMPQGSGLDTDIASLLNPLTPSALGIDRIKLLDKIKIQKVNNDTSYSENMKPKIKPVIETPNNNNLTIIVVVAVVIIILAVFLGRRK